MIENGEWQLNTILRQLEAMDENMEQSSIEMIIESRFASMDPEKNSRTKEAKQELLVRKQA